MSAQESAAVQWPAATRVPAVAARPSWSGLTAAALAVFLGVGVVLGVGVSRAVLDTPSMTTGLSGGGNAAAFSAPYIAYRETLANLTAAQERGDVAAMARFREALARQVTPAVIEGIYADQARIVSNMRAAYQRHDARMLAEFKAQLASLCGTSGAEPSALLCH